MTLTQLADKHQKELNQARPLLFKVAPLTATICWIYVFINILLFFSFFFYHRPIIKLLIVNNVLTFQFWGVLFLAVASFGLYSLLTNHWNRIRRALLAGIVVKMAWLTTLIIFTAHNFRQGIFITILWGFFAAIQAATYIFFLPEITAGRDNEQQSK